MPSATIIDETRSSSMPPYCSGSNTPTKPSSADLRSVRFRTSKSWCWMASRLGSTSRVQKSSVALAIARCSAVKSSGVNMSGGEASRKEPPKGVDIVRYARMSL